MKQGWRRLCRRTAIFCLECMAIFACLILLAGGIAMWRIVGEPVDVTFARDYIEQALHDPRNDHRIRVEKVMLSWPEIRGPLKLDFTRLRVLRKGERVLTVDSAAVEIEKAPLLIGRVRPVSILIQGPSLNLIRTKDDRIRLDIETTADRDSGENGGEGETALIADILETLRTDPDDPAVQGSPLASLERFRITNGRLVIEDHKMGLTWIIPEASAAMLRKPDGVDLTADMRLPANGKEDAHISARMHYAEGKADLPFRIEVARFNPAILSRAVPELDFLRDQLIPLEGRFEGVITRDLKLKSLQTDIGAATARIRAAPVYKSPLRLSDLALRANYTRQEDGVHKIVVESFRATNGPLKLDIGTRFALGGDGAAAIPVRLKAGPITPEGFARIWPDILRGEPIEEWMTKKLQKGTFSDIAVALDIPRALLNADKGDMKALEDQLLESLRVDFTFDDMTIDYRPPLMPVRQASGSGSIENDVLKIDIGSAELGDMAIQKANLGIDRLTKEGPGTADITIGLTGPVAEVLRYIKTEPIAVAGELAARADKIKGAAELDINITFPTLKDLPAEEIRVKAGATLNDLYIPDIVQGLPLQGGPFKLEAAEGRLELDGSGRLGEHEVTLAWKRYLDTVEDRPYLSRVRAEIVATPDLRMHFGADLSDFLTGSVPLDVTYTEKSGTRAEVELSGDLTPARFMVDPFDFAKPVEVEGKTTARILLEGEEIQEIRDFTLETRDASMEGGRFLFRRDEAGEPEIYRGRIKKVMLGENKFALEFEQDANDLLKLELKGRFLDATPFLDQDTGEEYDGPPVIVYASAQRMRTAETRIVDEGRIYAQIDAEGIIEQLEMDARAGEGDIYLRYKPDAQGDMHFTLKAGDAGAALRAFDIYDNMQGGKLTVIGRPLQPGLQKDDLKGTAKIEDFKIVNAPGLARLLNALSLTGIQQLLTDEGISFSRLGAKFEWREIEGEQVLILKDGRTSGASIGLTFSGRVNQTTDKVKIEGTIVPVANINRVIGAIPLVGEILTGGTGIFAATYKMSGQADDPEVSINPLSVLAPGIVRKMFFEGGWAGE